MKARGKNLVLLLTGMLVGLALAPTAANAVSELLTATPSTQTFYVDGQRVELEAYGINGYNYVKLRDVGQLVDFNVCYDPSRNAAIIEPDKPYTGEDVAATTPTPSVQPSEGTDYAHQANPAIFIGELTHEAYNGIRDAVVNREAILSGDYQATPITSRATRNGDVYKAALPNYILDPTEHHVELIEGKTATIALKNDRRPNLIINKRDADTDEPVPGTVFVVKKPDGHSVAEVTTGQDGSVTVPNLLPGVYEVEEKSVPAPYLLDAEAQTVTLYADHDREVTFKNHKTLRFQYAIQVVSKTVIHIYTHTSLDSRKNHVCLTYDECLGLISDIREKLEVIKEAKLGVCFHCEGTIYTDEDRYTLASGELVHGRCMERFIQSDKAGKVCFPASRLRSYDIFGFNRMYPESYDLNPFLHD